MNITPELREKIAKVYELVNRGATAGERQAARNRLDKILSKYNLDGIDLDNLDLTSYFFKYTSQLENWLLQTLVYVFLPHIDMYKVARKQTYKMRQIRIELKQLDYITLECSYEYFRRHMKAEWKKVCMPQVKSCRASKRKLRRAKLQDLFFNEYSIKSQLYREGDLKTMDVDAMSVNEQYDRALLIKNVEGGKYNRQVSNGLILHA